MAIKFLNPKFAKSINQKFRERRFSFFISLLQKIRTNTPLQILDIGGTEIFWERMNFLKNEDIHITSLNIFTTEGDVYGD